MTASNDFWTLRKQAVKAEETKVAKAALAQTEAQERKLQDKRTDEELLEELDLPNPDTLQSGDDFSAFMSKAVPDRLRRRALRKLWGSNPVLANVDGLVDYGEDFSDGAMVIENLQTTYQVGKGMLRHLEEIARQAEEETTTKTASYEDKLEIVPAVEVSEAAPTAPEEAASDTRVAASDEQAEIESEQPRRRMRFEYCDQELGINQ